jgi:hypothetical protein
MLSTFGRRLLKSFNRQARLWSPYTTAWRGAKRRAMKAFGQANMAEMDATGLETLTLHRVTRGKIGDGHVTDCKYLGISACTGTIHVVETWVLCMSEREGDMHMQHGPPHGGEMQDGAISAAWLCSMASVVWGKWKPVSRLSWIAGLSVTEKRVPRSWTVSQRPSLTAYTPLPAPPSNPPFACNLCPRDDLYISHQKLQQPTPQPPENMSWQGRLQTICRMRQSLTASLQPILIRGTYRTFKHQQKFR